MTPPEKKPSKLARLKRLAVSAAGGAMLGVVCQFLPEPYRLPCMAGIKLIALIFGTAAP